MLTDLDMVKLEDDGNEITAKLRTTTVLQVFH